MKRLVAPACLFLLLTACAPPFAPDIGAAVATLGKLTPVSTIGPLDISGIDLMDQYLCFYPVKTDSASGPGIDAYRGFVTYFDGKEVHLLFTWRTAGSSGTFDFFDGWKVSPPRTRVDLPFYQFTTLKYGDLVSVTLMDDQNPAANSQTVYQADTTTRTYAVQGVENKIRDVGLLLPAPNPGKGIGYSTGFPTNVAGENRSYWLYMLDASNTCVAFGYDMLDQPPVPFSVMGGFTPSLLGQGASRCLFFYNPNSIPPRNYAFIRDGDAAAWKGWCRGAGPEVIFPDPIPRPEAILTTGEFFCREGNMGYVYDQDMKRKLFFPLGPLRFVFESYENGDPTVFFVLPDNSDGVLYLDLYSIRTGSLSTLQ